MKDNTDSWIRTYTGGRAYFFEPENSIIEIQDIAHALSLLCRFNGATEKFYSISQHCCIIANQIYDETNDPYLAFSGLMHDAQEAFVSDIPSPFKRRFPEFVEAEKRFEIWLAQKFGYALDLPIVKKHDLKCLATEMRDLMRVSDHKAIIHAPYSFKITPESPEKAKQEFLFEFEFFSEQCKLVKA
jgi:5'-deoxynucleotidase YfbR-like HD superfamily hydrolase